MILKKHSLLLVLNVILIIFVLHCNNEKNDWKKAESNNTVEAYQSFLIKYPKSDYSAQAQMKIEKYYFKKAETSNTITAYEKFKKKYPKSPLINKIPSKIENIYFEQAKSADTIQAFERFLDKYSKGKNVDKMRKMLQKRYNKRHPVFRNTKTVLLIVEESYGRIKNVSLPFKELTRKILVDYTGLRVVDSDSNEYDVILTIKAKGAPISAHYNIGTQYTGATLDGEILIEVPGKPSQKKLFKGIISPPSSIHSRYPNPSSAPFKSTLYEPGSFICKMFEIISELYGNDTLIAALLEGEDVPKNGVYKIKAIDIVRGKRLYEAIKPLINITMTHRSQLFREEAAKALAKMKDEKMVDTFIDLFKNEEENARANAVMALGKIKDKRALGLLIHALKDNNKKVRFNAVGALGEIKDRSAVEPIISVLNNKHEDNGVRSRAAISLGKIKDTRSIKPLAEVLKDTNEKVRQLAAKALGELKATQAIDALINALKDKRNDKYPYVKWTIYYALEKITGKKFDSWNSCIRWWERNKKKRNKSFN